MKNKDSNHQSSNVPCSLRSLHPPVPPPTHISTNFHQCLPDIWAHLTMWPVPHWAPGNTMVRKDVLPSATQGGSILESPAVIAGIRRSASNAGIGDRALAPNLRARGLHGQPQETPWVPESLMFGFEPPGLLVHSISKSLSLDQANASRQGSPRPGQIKAGHTCS